MCVCGGGGATLACGLRRRGKPIRTTGKKAWPSVYSVGSSIIHAVYEEEDLNHGCLVLQLLCCPVLLDLGIFGPLVGAQDHQQPIQRFNFL